MELNNMTSVQDIFAQMTTDELRELLDKELHSEPVNDDAIRLIRGILRERNQNVTVVMTPELTKAWAKYQQDTDRIWQGSRKVRQIRQWVLRAASVAAVLVLLLIPIIPQEAGAESLWDTLTRWTAEIIEFFGSNDNEGRIEEYKFKTDNPGLQHVYDSVIELGVTVPVVPMWLPEGYNLVEYKHVTYPAKIRLYAVFEYSYSEIVYYMDIYSTDVSHKYQKDATEIEKHESGGVIHQLFRNNGRLVAVWNRDRIECSIFADCQEDTLYRILNSIYDTEEN